MAQYVSGRQPFLNVGIPGITTNSPVMNITGRVGIGTTDPSADLDLSTIRVRESIFDTNNFSGELGYFLTKDNTGIVWTAVPPLNNNAIFVSQDSVILGVSSYTGINFVSNGDDLVSISTNSGNTNIVDVRISSRWNKNGNTGIYTSKYVGIGSTTPTVALDVIGNAAFTGVVTATKFVGEFGNISKNLEVGSLIVTGVSTFIGVSTFSNIGIGTTNPTSKLYVVGDGYFTGVVTAFSFTADNFYGTATAAKYAPSSGVSTSISIGATTFDGNISYPVLVGLSGVTTQQPFIDSESLSYNGQSNTLNSNNIKVGFITATNAWIGIATIDDLKVGFITAKNAWVGIATVDDIKVGVITATNAWIGVATINNLAVVNDTFRVGTAITMNNGIITATTFIGKFLDFEFLKVTGIATINTGIVTNLSVTNLKVSGVSTFVGIATFGTVGIGTTNVIGNDALTIIGNARLGGKFDTFGVGTSIVMSNGIITATTYSGKFLDFEFLTVTGIATINSGIVTNLSVTNLKVSGISTFVGIATFGTVGIGTTNVIGNDALTIIGNARLGGKFDTFGVGTSIVMSNGIITATTYSGKFLDFEFLKVTGFSTFTNGPVAIGTGTSTGTASQPLQVTGGAYVSGNLGIGTTNPTSKLWVNGDGYFVGVVTSAGFYVDGNLIGSGSVSVGPIVGTALSISGISTLGTVKISSGIVTAATPTGVVTFFGNFVGTASSAGFAQTAFNLDQDAASKINVAYAATAGIATYANNIKGGAGGQIPYQSAFDTTELLANGDPGYLLRSNGGTLAPSWASPQGLTIGYANTAGVSTSVIGGIASVTSLFVTTNGISTLGTVKISSGIITSNTATGIVTYYGDGSKLTGVSGVNVQFQQLVGDPVYPTLANNSGVSSIGIVTSGNNALVFIPSSGSLGIGTANPTAKLDVNGDIRLRSGLYDSNNFIGDLNSILVSTGSSVTWSSLGDLGGSDITIQIDESTPEPQYLVFTNVTSGSSYTEKVSPTKLTYIASSGNLGIGISIPSTPLSVERYGVKTGFGTFVASAGITTDVDNFLIVDTDFKTAEYTIHIQSSSSVQAQKVLVMQNGLSAFSQEYAIMYDPTFMVSIGATVSGGRCKLQFTPESGISGLMTYRFTRETMK